jgi:hypothetical protein
LQKVSEPLRDAPDIFFRRRSALVRERPRRGCVLFFGALNLFAVGIVGEYIAKIMEEVKARPRLIRAALIKALAKPKLGFRLF